MKEQHLETDIAFLSKELKVTDEQTARNRVFFVSAKEVRPICTPLPGLQCVLLFAFACRCYSIV